MAFVRRREHVVGHAPPAERVDEVAVGRIETEGAALSHTPYFGLFVRNEVNRE
jgi:hypothetical protein